MTADTTSRRVLARLRAPSPRVRSSARHAALVVGAYAALFTAFFAPVVLRGRFLSPGDALLQYLPNFYAPRALWEPLLLGGFPIAADPQAMTWYPLALICAQLSAWNVFMLAAYVLASSFAYGYVHTLTGSRLAGAVSGLTYGLSGFMFAHLGHATVIHGAAWLALVIWSIEMLRRRASGAWLVVGALAVACNFLAGHPQIFFYSQMLAAAYACVRGWSAPAGRVRFYLAALAVFALGVGMAAIQWLPTAELTTWTVRERLSFMEFVTYSLPTGQLPMLLFPYLFGGSTWYGPQYFGAWNLPELTGYVGLLPLALAALGALRWRERALLLFWLGVMVCALLLALGAATPLASLVFHLPVLNKFRAPARHLLELTLAASVLAGLGTAAISRGLPPRRLVLTIVVLLGLLVTGSLAVVMRYPQQLSQQAAGSSRSLDQIALAPWTNPATGVPMLVLLAGAAVLIYWVRAPHSRLRVVALLIVLTLDLASFGWFCYWQDDAPVRSFVQPPAAVPLLRPVLDETHQRLTPMRGGLGARDEVLPNISRLWGVASTGAYGPLLIRRVGQLASMNTAGVIEPRALNMEDRGLDLLATRYLLLPVPSSPVSPPGTGATKWATEDLDLPVGSGCDSAANPVLFNLPAPVAATKLGVVSWLGCASPIADDAQVARILVTDAGGHVAEHTLVAGRDTAEFAYDCADVRGQMHHRRATVFSSFPIERASGPCEGHRYLTTIPLAGPTEVKSIEVRWAGPEGGVFALRKLSLLDESRGLSYAVGDGMIVVADHERWRYVGDAGGARVYENVRAQPRAWLVHEALALGADEVLAAVKTSRLPDGRAFDPARMALVEKTQFAFKADAGAATDAARVTGLTRARMEVQTASAAPALLVTSDVYYPGWTATVDGKPTPLVRTDYALRGVPVPAGAHTVVFVFHPQSFYAGAGVSAAALVALLLVGWVAHKRRPAAAA